MKEKAPLVLVVDDDEGIRGLEAEILAAEGYKVEQADSGAAAIAQLRQIQPALVLLDLLMPEVDCWAVLRFIRTTPDPPRVVLVSGLREIVPPGDLTQCVAGSLHKPFNIADLIKTCANVLAAPALLSPATGLRKDTRRTFVVESTLLSHDGTPLAVGRLLDVSRHGFRLELALALKPGDPVNLTLHIPGREQPLQLSGCVRWRHEFVMGAEAEGLTLQDQALLRELVGSTPAPEPDDDPQR